MRRWSCVVLPVVFTAAAAAAPAPKETPVWTDGTVSVAGAPLHYRAALGILTVHPKGADRADFDRSADDNDQDKEEDDKAGDDKEGDDKDAKPAAAAMSYVAYFASAAHPETRPLTFFFNGGPGSSTLWLHMGSFGPRRVVTADAAHTPPAPYRLDENPETLLDTTDLVFVDAPGTGFGRLSGKDAAHQFYAVDGDAHAFAAFITQFLSRYGRWNSPKYLFGESYGTTRAAVVALMLENEWSLDLNGIILLSQALSFDLSPDSPGTNPGIDLPYVLALPTYAATAWYHHKLPADHPDLPAFLHGVEDFATGDYLSALAAGASLTPSRRDAVAQTLHDDTGLPADYIARADLRIDGGEFEQTLLGTGVTGRLDTRFSGPPLDPMAKESGYDPQDVSISSAFVSLFNDYVRRTLKYDGDRAYKAEFDPPDWDLAHQPPGSTEKLTQSLNVMPDLAAALIENPTMRVQLDSGYFDLATPYYEGIYEMRHLPMPARLQANIEFHQYRSGHMVYVNDAALKSLHDDVATFIDHTHVDHTHVADHPSPERKD